MVASVKTWKGLANWGGRDRQIPGGSLATQRILTDTQDRGGGRGTIGDWECDSVASLIPMQPGFIYIITENQKRGSRRTGTSVSLTMEGV